MIYFTNDIFFLHADLTGKFQDFFKTFSNANPLMNQIA